MLTTEWNKQAEEMFKAWTDVQRKMWDEWPRTIQGFVKSQPGEVWEKGLQAWEESVKKTLDAQAEWTRLWAENFSTVSGLPKEVVEWAREGQEMTERWTETQKVLWENWFKFAKQFNSSKLGENWEQEGQRLAHAWQEAAKKAMDDQSEWLRTWTKGQQNKRAE